MTGKLVKEDEIFYVKKDGLKYPLTLKCLKIVSEIENQDGINFKKPVKFQVVSEDNIKKCIIAAVAVQPKQYVKPKDEDIEDIHLYVSMLQAALDFSESKSIVKAVWATPYSRALMAETNLELSRIAGIPFKHIQEPAGVAMTQFQDSTTIMERLFKLCLAMSKMDDESRLKLECQLDNIFTFHGINL